MDWGQAIVQTMVALLGSGVLVGLINYLLTRSKVRAEAAQIATTTSTDYNAQLYERLTKENERLSHRQDDLEADRDIDKARIQVLERYAWRSQSWMARAYDGIQRLIEGHPFTIEHPPELEPMPAQSRPVDQP